MKGDLQNIAELQTRKMAAQNKIELQLQRRDKLTDELLVVRGIIREAEDEIIDIDKQLATEATDLSPDALKEIPD